MITANDNTGDLTAQALIALRNEADALRVITARLRVKEMGPADHIRTKHEVKAFLESGAHNLDTAEKIIREARMRREHWLAVTQTQMQQESQNQSQRLGENPSS